MTLPMPTPDLRALRGALAPLLVGTLGLLASCSDAPEQASAADSASAAVPASTAGSDRADAVTDDGNIPAGNIPAGNPFGFETWHADYPGQPHLSPRVPGRWYDRSRRQALQSVVDKLQGNCSRDAWLFAKRFASGIGVDDLEVLVEKLDASLQIPAMSDTVENVLDAIGRAGHPAAAEAVLRGLQHDKASVRDAAMQALIGAGNADAVRRARSMFDAVRGRGMNGWLLAARAHLPAAECAAAYRTLLADPRYTQLHPKIVEHAVGLPAADALAALSVFDGHEPIELVPMISGLRHASGDRGGSARMRDLLRHESPEYRRQALATLTNVPAGDLLDDVLRATADPDPEVRLASVSAVMCSGAPVDVIAPALETLTIDEFADVRRAALKGLVELGRTDALEELVFVVRQATGTRLMRAIDDLVAARYSGAIPALAERMEGETGDRREGYIRAIALTTRAEAFLPLRDAFASTDAEWTPHHGFLAYMMANCRGAELAVLELFEDLPRDDYRRRGMLLRTLGDLAADREDAEVTGPIFARLRELLVDREEIPQIRLSALQFLRRELRIEDVARLKVLLADEQPPMRKALTAFLFEFF